MDPKEARHIAGIELNALVAAKATPAKHLDGAIVGEEATPIYDINGEVLFFRLPVTRGRQQVSFIDIADHEVLGDPLLAVSSGVAWEPRAIAREARDHAKELGFDVEKADDVRFVAYSYPKIAIAFLAGDQELAMIEWMTGAAVPQSDAKARDRERLEPEHFERWSIIEETPDDIREERSENYRARRELLAQVDLDRPWRIAAINWQIFVIQLFATRELTYSLRSGDHDDCYELRGQETNVWCVGASTQMLLDFYRYEYTQTRLAQELGLGTMANPNGLPYARVGDVVTAIEALTSNGLDATMITNPTFDLFRDEINANRPLISFVPGHSRTVAGYWESFISLIHAQPYKGLLVFDPWPPNAGVITRWENVATQTYQYAYTAKVKKI